MELGQVQQQSLKLKMTTELKQAISILQFSTQELTDYIYNLVTENPLLEIKESTEINPSYFPTSGYSKDGHANMIDSLSGNELGLREDLLQQARLLSIDKECYRIVSYLILQLDDDGYLRDDLEEIAEKLDTSFSDVLEALEELQSLEPAGIGARNLEECLLLQVGRLHPNNELAKEIIKDHLVQVARGDLEFLQEQLNVPVEDIQKAVVVIQSLNPKPGLIEAAGNTDYIRPDLVVKKESDQYEIHLVDRMPSINMNHEYDDLLASTAKNSAVQFIHQKYKQYQWLMKSIEQRKRTLLNVTRSIMNRQSRFLEWGPKAMAPLTLKEIADELSLHESTVSRAVRDKYVQTPHGIYELRDFFSSAVKTETLNGISSKSVKILIKEMIEAEDPKQPFSDQAITDMLKRNKGIDISRRAVAKYRTALKIPSSTRRKQLF